MRSSGPRARWINTIQGETGADISVDDDGMVGVVSVSAVDGGAVAEAERQIRLILDPPTPEVNAEYTGKVVSITKFGAFINILPDGIGLLHISKIGGGKRIDKVEDVLELGRTSRSTSRTSTPTARSRCAWRVTPAENRAETPAEAGPTPQS
ncbi:MAG: S1 RNA-binding domain-containing protein [Microthrixaceae bacterium]